MMQTTPTNEPPSLMVIPLFDLVLFPECRTKLLVSTATGEYLLSQMEETGTTSAIGLTVKSGIRPADLTVDSLCRIGNLL